MLQFDRLMERKHNARRITWSRPSNFPQIQKILPCRPNNLPSIAVPETIAKNIINLAKNNKTDIAKAAVSGIIPRRDTSNLKAKQVNKALKKIHEEKNIPFISHHGIEINTRFHLNSHDLHLNDKGATRLDPNYKKFLSDIEFV